MINSDATVGAYSPLGVKIVRRKEIGMEIDVVVGWLLRLDHAVFDC